MDVLLRSQRDAEEGGARISSLEGRVYIALNGWRASLEIKTLGQFALFKEGEPLQFRCKTQRKPIELLKALVVYGGCDVCEETLSGVLWPDAEGDAAHRSYNTTLHRLRKLIGSRAVRVNHGRASLDRSYCWLDLWSYFDLCDQLELMLERPQVTSEQIDGATAALTHLYQGPFLKSEAETPALLTLREQLRSRLERTLKMVVLCYSQAGRCECALKLYQKMLEIDELSEELYRGVIACYAALGLYSEALAAYENCRRVLETIFGIVPSKQTQLLRHAIVTSGNNRLSREEIKKYLFFSEKNSN